MAKRKYTKRKEYIPEETTDEPAEVVIAAPETEVRYIVMAQMDGTGAWSPQYDGARRETADEIAANLRRHGINVRY